VGSYLLLYRLIESGIELVRRAWGAGSAESPLILRAALQKD
jgi:hypothetical protein